MTFSAPSLRCAPRHLSLRNLFLYLCLLTVFVSGQPLCAAEKPDVIVMIHGAGGGGWEYELWQPLFEKAGWKVIAPDLVPARGGLIQTTFADYLHQVQGWLPGERRHLILVGASMGGILALKAAETLHPDAVVLVNSALPSGLNLPRKPKSYPAIIRWANGPLQDTRDALPDSDEATIQRAYPRWRDESGAVLNALAKGIPVKRPVCPTLVVLGERDTDIPHANGLALAHWLEADVHLYKATSHVGPLLGKRAVEIAEAVRHWLDARLYSAKYTQDWDTKRQGNHN